MPENGRHEGKEIVTLFLIWTGCEVVHTSPNFKFGRSMKTNGESVFINPSVARHFSELHDKYVVIPADKDTSLIIIGQFCLP